MLSSILKKDSVITILSLTMSKKILYEYYNFRSSVWLEKERIGRKENQ